MVRELQSPLTTHLLNRLRSAQTDAAAFRLLVRELTLLLANEAFSASDLHTEPLLTWQGEASYALLREEAIVFVTILRAGLPMLDALTALCPKTPAGFLAMKRDETTHEAKLYYDRVPECRGKHVVIADPMVATGGSLIDAVDLLYKKGAAKVTSLNIIASPEGIDNVVRRHRDLALFVAKIDNALNADKFIIPGLGDAGDRAFNTVE